MRHRDRTCSLMTLAARSLETSRLVVVNLVVMGRAGTGHRACLGTRTNNQTSFMIWDCGASYRRRAQFLSRQGVIFWRVALFPWERLTNAQCGRNSCKSCSGPQSFACAPLLLGAYSPMLRVGGGADHNYCGKESFLFVVLFQRGCLTNAPCGRRGCKSCSRAREVHNV